MIREKNMTLIFTLACLSAIFTSGLLAPHLYIDPNTGGMLFQMLAVILALFSGILFFFSRQIKMIFARLRRRLRNEPTPQESEEPKPEE